MMDKAQPKDPLAIRRELARIKKEQDRRDLPATVRAELYGAAQALYWVIESSETMAPSECALIAVAR